MPSDVEWNKGILNVKKIKNWHELIFPEFIPMSELTLGAVLGEGEFGSVLRATYSPGEQSPQQVAVKTLHMQHTETNQKEFLSEAKLMMSLRHRCIVRIIGVSLVSHYQELQIHVQNWYVQNKTLVVIIFLKPI